MKQLFFIILFLPFMANSQTITTSAGFAGYGSPIDGYFFSFDIGVPINKSLTIAPTFSFMSNVNSEHGKFYIKTMDDILRYKNLHINKGRQSGLIEVFLYVKPLSIFKSKKLKEIDFNIGAGYGLSVHSFNFFYTSKDGNITAGSEYGFYESYSFKLNYNYHIKKYFFGIVAGITDMKAYGNSLIGLQFGIGI